MTALAPAPPLLPPHALVPAPAGRAERAVPAGARATGGWAVGVVVPARDEEATIAACVEAVRASLDASTVERAHVVVVADRCGDGTARRARRALGPAGEVVVTDVGRVGAARRIGVARALAVLGAMPAGGTAAPAPRPERTWLIGTDADTVVPRGWVQGHLDLAEEGAAAVAGTVRVAGFAEHAPAVEATFRARYLVAPDGSHGHVHGANIGVRADAYAAVGGWPRLATAEDHALWARLVRGGWPVVASGATWVTTSGRAEGRAPYGFAHRLASYGAEA